MKFGASTFLTDESISPAVLGPALEECGLSALFLAEHTHIPVGSEVSYRGYELPHGYFRTLDPFLDLTAAAAAT